MEHKKTGIVLEGGAMRGIFTAGALDYLLEQDMYFDYVVGVSAGAGNAMNYVSRQIGRTKRVIMHENAESYYGLNQLFEHRKLLNIETMIQEYALNEIPFDFDAYFASEVENENVVLNCETGRPEYMGNFPDKDSFFKATMASCSVPFICEPIEINGYHYLDGSIADSVPVERAITLGCKKVVVILTKPEGSEATDYSKMRSMIDLCYKKYPKLCDALCERRSVYVKQMQQIKKLENDGRIFVLRPKEQMVHHFEKDNDKLTAFYNYGYETMKGELPRLKTYLDN